MPRSKTHPLKDNVWGYIWRPVLYEIFYALPKTASTTAIVVAKMASSGKKRQGHDIQFKKLVFKWYLSDERRSLRNTAEHFDLD